MAEAVEAAPSPATPDIREETEQNLKPTEVRDEFFVHVSLNDGRHRHILGKWMVFRHYDEIDETWEKVRSAVLHNELQGCAHAKCSTMCYNPSSTGPGPDKVAVICVYTEEHDMDAIGFKLIELVQQDIKYKRDMDTLDGMYAFSSSVPVSVKTIYWNNGKPSFVCEDKPCHKTSHRREDIWHLNVVEAPKCWDPGPVYGRWVLFPDNEELTWLWHELKSCIESESEDFGVIKMVCPPKRNRRNLDEKPEFHLHTSKERKREVGLKLIRMVEGDIVYQFKPDQEAAPPTRDRPPPARRGGPRSREEVLFWNDGEPDFERVRRKGITKNWRTGEDI